MEFSVGFRLAFLSLSTFALACSSSGSSDATTPDDAGVVLSSDESDVFDTTGGALATHQENATLADSLFDFDPTIDPSATPAANAAAIEQNALANMSTCGTATVAGATVTVSFGAPPGCTLATGVVVSGTVTLAVSKSGNTTTILMTLEDVVVNGEALSGQTSFATMNGSTFTVQTNDTANGKTTAAALTVVGAANEFTISGTSTTTSGATTTTVTLTNVVHGARQCYANAGTMQVTRGVTSETITFDANTPATGKVTVEIGKRTSTLTLKPYGSCPSGASVGDASVRD